MARIAYFRVSTADQSIEAQRHALGGTFEREFVDEGVSGATLAADRAGFAELLKFVRGGDTLHVYAVDRLGRDALDVQSTVRSLINRGLIVDVHGLGTIGRGVGELVLAVLAQIADMERQRIRERCEAGRVAARDSLSRTGLTHRGKRSLGRQPILNAKDVAAWRRQHGKSIAETARHYGISKATVSRYCGEAQRA